MSERDAFGREKGEDTLADMGWSDWKAAPSTETPAPSPTPAPEPVKPTFTSGTPLDPPAGPAWAPGPPAGYRRRRSRRVRGLFVPLFLIGVLAVGILGAATVLQAGSDALDRFEGAVRDAVPTTAGTGGSGESLIRSAALKAALRKLPAGDVELLRVAPERINANVIVDGRMHVVQVTAGGEVSDVATPAKGSGDAVRVNASAPSRIAQTAARRAGRRPGSVSYLVVMSIGGKPEWQLFFDDGLHFSASASGKKVRRVG